MHFYATKETQDLGTWAVVTSCFLGDYMVHLAQFQEVVAIFFLIGNPMLAADILMGIQALL